MFPIYNLWLLLFTLALIGVTDSGSIGVFCAVYIAFAIGLVWRQAMAPTIPNDRINTSLSRGTCVIAAVAITVAPDMIARSCSITNQVLVCSPKWIGWDYASVVLAAAALLALNALATIMTPDTNPVFDGRALYIIGNIGVLVGAFVARYVCAGIWPYPPAALWAITSILGSFLLWLVARQARTPV